MQQKDQTVDISYSDIIAIDRPKDGLGNGALTFGLAVGAAVGVGLGNFGRISRQREPFLWDGVP